MPVPIELDKLRVTSLDIDFHEVTWRVAPTTRDIFDFSFQVLRSESVEGPWDALTPPFQDQYTFVDNVVQVAHRWRSYCYLIRVIERSSGDTKDFGPVAHEPEADIIAVELRRHIRLLMREFAGRRCIVLPKRTFGQRCPDCWNATLQKVTKSGCMSCFCTGFARGYLHPIETWIQIDPSSKSEQHLNTGNTQQDNTTLRLGFYPIIKPGDLIIEAENLRWVVTGQTQTEHSRAAVHQEVQVHAVEPKDIEFSIPVSFSAALKNLFITPARNFTNPFNLANFEDEEIPGIFDLYPSTYPKEP